VLHVSRAERGLTRLRLERRLLAPLVEEAVTAFRRMSDEGDGRVIARVDETIGVRVDAWAFRQMLLNLLDNAVKYGPPAQTIVIEAGTVGDRVQLHVDDEGSGIPEQQRDRVFAPFVRLEIGKAAAPGSGIGLAVVRELAELHGGRALASASPRGGARLTIELPLAAPEPVPDEPVGLEESWMKQPSMNGNGAHAAHPADRG
jgi:signal transduction histidine kinase